MHNISVRKGIVFCVIFLFVGTGFLTSISHTKGNPNLMNEWSYFRVIDLSNSINDYQMLINVSKYSDGDISCNGHCNDDFGDIRFLDIDNITLIDYWIEKKVDGNYAWFWIELSSDIETDQKILIYYGNPFATSISNGHATFLWFDDFSIDTSGDWEKIQSVEPDVWNFYNTEFETTVHSARLRSNVDCIDINSRNFAGHAMQDMKVENNTDTRNYSTLSHWYNSDWQASENQPSTNLRTIDGSGDIITDFQRVMMEGVDGYVTELLYSYPDNILRGKIWDSTDNQLWIRSLSSYIPDDLTYLYWHMTDYHASNGGSGVETGIFYDVIDNQLIIKCVGSYYSPSDSWLELHYSWMFLGQYAENEPYIINVGVEKPTLIILLNIDIKPGDYPNSINPNSNGKIPVAILTTEDFDVTNVDINTVVFLGGSPYKYNYEDIDNDGDNDLLIKFKTQELDFSLLVDEGDEYPYGYLTGETFSNIDVEGKDTIRVIGPLFELIKQSFVFYPLFWQIIKLFNN